MARRDALSQIDPKKMFSMQGGKLHPSYDGVLEAAHENGLLELHEKLVQIPSAENGFVAVAEATAVFTGPDGRERIFSGIGDADDKNTNRMIALHKIRMACTRAKGRALRDALGIGVALMEEMGGSEEPAPRHEPAPDARPQPAREQQPAPASNGGGLSQCEYPGCQRSLNQAQRQLSIHKCEGRVLCPEHQALPVAAK